MSSSLPILWLVGGSSELGLAIAEALQFSHHIISISRNQKRENSPNYTHFSLDLTSLQNVKEALIPLKEQFFPSAIVFCQRYRHSNEEANLTQAMNLEIFSPQKMIEEISQTSPRNPLSIVILSSVNGYLINNRLPFWYHLLKSSQIQLVKYYSQFQTESPLQINCITAGSFLKKEPEMYPAEHRLFLDALLHFNVPKKLPTIQEITHLIGFLISDKAQCINGQTITFDGGLTNKLQEELIQRYDQQKR